MGSPIRVYSGGSGIAASSLSLLLLLLLLRGRLMKTNEKRVYQKKCVRLINLARWTERNETAVSACQSTRHWIPSIVFLFYGGFRDQLAHLSLSWHVRKRMLLDMPDRMRHFATFRHADGLRERSCQLACVEKMSAGSAIIYNSVRSWTRDCWHYRSIRTVIATRRI